MATLEIIRNVNNINQAVHENAHAYKHSNPVASPRHGLLVSEGVKHPVLFHYDIKDLFTIGAITQSSILMTGGTDLGKTTLAKLVMNALFGKEEAGWHRIDIDNDFGSDTLADTDFGVITEGKRLSEGLYRAMPWLGLPGLITDEINRGASKLLNKLLHVLDRDISLPDGTRAKVGWQLPSGETYQFQVAAINEGKEYAGTFDIDRALRRRTTIEIPMEIFSPTPFDRLALQKMRGRPACTNETSRLENVLAIYSSDGRHLPFHPLAEIFLSSLEQFDYCKRSMSGSKGSVESRGGSVHHICTQPFTVNGVVTGGEVGCEFLRAFPNDLCPHVRGITPGVSKGLQEVARGFALLRGVKFVELVAGWQRGENVSPLSYTILTPDRFRESLVSYVGKDLDDKSLARAAAEQYLTRLEVEIPDIEAAAGFVGFSKIGIAPPFVTKHYQGNKFEAIRAFLTEARMKFETGLADPSLAHLQELLQSKSPDLYAITEYCSRENPWLLRALTPYFDARQRQQQTTDAFDIF